MKLPIYLDNNATTPLDPMVLEAMMPYLTECYGNAASRNHRFGREAESAVETARAQVAALLGAAKMEIIFTSGATESNNIAIKGVVEAYRHKGDHIVTTKTEHKSVLDTCRRLEQIRAAHIESLKKFRMTECVGGRDVTAESLGALVARHDFVRDQVFRSWLDLPMPGARVTYLNVDREGKIGLQDLEEAITEKTILVSCMLANNEIGTVHPVAEIGRICRQKEVLFHCDAVQGLGKVAFNVEETKVDLVSVSGHKMYGPKGVGALYVRRNPQARVVPLFDGGGQERGLRAGTLNVAGIVGLGKAAEVSRLGLVEEAARMRNLREILRRGLLEQLNGITVNGPMVDRLPGNLNVSFAYVEGEALIMALKDVAVSTGSACSSALLEPSHVLQACGIDASIAHGSIRFGLGRFNTEEEIRQVVDLVVKKVQEMRRISPLCKMASG